MVVRETWTTEAGRRGGECNRAGPPGSKEAGKVAKGGAGFRKRQIKYYASLAYFAHVAAREYQDAAAPTALRFPNSRPFYRSLSNHVSFFTPI